MGANVKELLFDNVRGRVREFIWNEIKKDLSQYEKAKNPDDEQKIRYLYERTKAWYARFEPLLKEMETDETAEDSPGHRPGDAPQRRRRSADGGPEDHQVP